MPPDGGLIRSENVHVKPLFPKVRFNTSLNIRVLGGPVRSNGLPRGHADLNNGHPGLSEDRIERVFVIEVFPTSFGPEVV